MVKRWIGFDTEDYEFIKSFGPRLRVVKYKTGYSSLQVEMFTGAWEDIFITARPNTPVLFKFQDLGLIAEFIRNECKSYLEADHYYELFNDNGFDASEVPVCGCTSKSHVSSVNEEDCFEKYMNDLKKLFEG